MKKAMVCVALVGLLTPSLVYGDPSPEVKKLMDDPVSMLDLGLYKLQLDVEEWLLAVDDNQEFEFSLDYIGYNWEDNKIEIHCKAWQYPEESSSRRRAFRGFDTEEHARSVYDSFMRVWKKVHDHFFNSPYDIANYFGHNGYAVGGEKKSEFWTNLISIIRLEVDMLIVGESSYWITFISNTDGSGLLVGKK